MSEAQTCGNGLAARATMPETLARLTLAMAEILAFHRTSLDVTDPNGARELIVYVRVEQQYLTVSSLLASTADEMLRARNLPMAHHDVRVLASAENAAIFRNFVGAEREVMALIQGSIEPDEAMLRQMSA